MCATVTVRSSLSPLNWIEVRAPDLHVCGNDLFQKIPTNIKNIGSNNNHNIIVIHKIECNKIFDYHIFNW